MNREVSVNEVQAMAKIGEAVGTVLGTTVLATRKAAVGLNRAGAAARSRRAARRSGTRQVQETVMDGAHRTQEVLAHSASQARESLAEGAHHLRDGVLKARRELAAIEPRQRVRARTRRRHWTWWLLTILLTVAGAAAYVLSRRPQERSQQEDTAHPSAPSTPPRADPAGNGSVPHATAENPANPPQR